MMLKSLTKLRKRQGQQILEYAIVASIVAVIMMVMTTYVYRAVQATQQKIQKGFSE